MKTLEIKRTPGLAGSYGFGAVGGVQFTSLFQTSFNDKVKVTSAMTCSTEMRDECSLNNGDSRRKVNAGSIIQDTSRLLVVFHLKHGEWDFSYIQNEVRHRCTQKPK